MADFGGKKSLRKQLLAGGGLTALALAVNSLLVLILNIMLARFLAPSDLGTYLLLLSLAFTVGAIPQLGVQRAVIRFVSESMAIGNVNAARDFAVDATIIVLIASFAAATLLAIFPVNWLQAAFPSWDAKTLSFFGPALVALFAVRNVTAEAFRGYHEVGWATFHSRLSVNFFLLLTLGLAALFVARLSIEALGGLMVSIAALAALASTGHLLMLASATATKAYQVRVPREMFRCALPLAVTTFLMVAAQEAHIWILSAEASPGDTAVFGLVMRVGSIIALPLLVLNGVFPQVVAQLVRLGDLGRLQRLVRTTTSLLALLAGLIVLFLFFYGADILRLLFGEFYAAGYPALLLVALAQGAAMTVGAAMQFMMMGGRERELAVITVVASCVGILVTALTVPWFGDVGAAMGYAVGVMGQCIAVWTYCRTRLEMRFLLSPRLLWTEFIELASSFRERI